MGTKIEGVDPYLGLSQGEIESLEKDFLFPTYKRYDLFLSHGSGAYVFDMGGRRYLDFLAGIAVNSLGYNHPRLVKVLKEQGARLIHCSNLFYHPFQGILAKRLAELAGMSKVFFTNSGTEAIEAALKISRAYAHKRGKPGKSRMLALRNSFHGRTFGALSITSQEKYQAPFRPLVPGAEIIEEISVAGLERAFSDDVCAMVMEPIQGEGGVYPVPHEFLLAARNLCNRHDTLLIFDEIQCGLGRTGRYFAFQHCGVVPDLLTLAKSLAAGYPLGAVLGSQRVADSLQPGEHGTTFGGGPLACRLALEVLEVIEDEGLLDHVARLGEQLVRGLRELAPRHRSMGEIRGMGLMVGVDLGTRTKRVVQGLLKRGVIANAAHESVLRLLPPFIITEEEVNEFLRILSEVLGEVEAETDAA
ncbi:MAG TPA: aspartate aminotransferase family protein [Acidobacteriota bacterium]|nr:aspartate aminotransferase family protein [Acidobacteriota bacterium]